MSAAEHPSARLETDRLLLRMFREDDFDAYARIFGDPDVARYLGNGKPLERWEAWRSLAYVLGHWSMRGSGLWAVEEKSTGRLVGQVGLYHPDGWPGFELGRALGREHWGRGYATESARRALAYAFTKMGRDRVISLIHPENAGARRSSTGSPEGAQLVGIQTSRIHGLCFGAGIAMSAVTGSLVSMLFELTPFMGLPYTITALVVVILGALGNMVGCLLAGLLLGLVEPAGVYLASSDIRLISSYAVLSLILVLKPSGLIGR